MISGDELDLGAVRGKRVNSGVAQGDALLAFTDAVINGEYDAIAASRDCLVAALGEAGMVEAAAIITMFNIVDRVADATGIPIDDGPTRDMRYAIGEELGMRHLSQEHKN